MDEQIEKLEHGLMICEATGTELVHIEKADAEKILVLLKEQEAEIEQLNRFVNGFSRDAMPVVMCKDCKRKDTLSCPKAPVRPDDWFCADGKRR